MATRGERSIFQYKLPGSNGLTLLSTSVIALSKMVGICEEYAKEYDIVFNCKKTVGIQIGNRCNNCVIKLNGNEIKWQRIQWSI